MARTELKRHLTPDEQESLIQVLKARFVKNMHRHTGIDWKIVQQKLEANPDKLRSLHEMEATGGEPDVTGFDDPAGSFIFCDCSPETPAGRRNLCYDREALDSRKEFKPADSAMDMAASMGVELLSEAEYLELQNLGALDTKTSSWLKTPPPIRKLGGAIFGDHRFGRVFVYHNGASSYYAARGFRGSLRI